MGSTFVDKSLRRFFVALAVLFAGAAHGQGVRRLALVVGSNQGTEKPRLRYAEADAERMARALSEVSAMRAQDVEVLKSPKTSEVVAALERARKRVREHRRGKTFFVFYYSGHATPAGLDLGGDELSFARVKQLLKETGADVRVGLIDACNSAAILEAGGRPAAPFSIEVEDELRTTGEVFVTSSAHSEKSLESSEYKGGVFTHFLLSGLRGAADHSGDELVSINELYRYAYQQTTETAPQHPGIGLQLSGFGEVVLGFVAKGPARLVLPEGFERAVVLDTSRSEVVAKLDRHSARSLAVPPGRYGVQVWRAEQALGATLDLRSGQRRELKWGELIASEGGEAD